MKRRLGRSGIEVSAFGLGCWAIGGPLWKEENAVGWSTVDDSQSVRALHAALEAGVTFFDTADVYGAGHSERLVGKALKGRRGDAVIATKFGNVFDEKSKQITGSDARPAYIREACDASLKRLGTDYIDLYQFHIGDYNLDAAVAVRDVLEELVSRGKIRAYAWSTDLPVRARYFGEGEHGTACQHQMNVLDDAPELVSLCEELDLASINRGPLAMGLLSGKYKSGTALPEDDVRGEHSPSWVKYFSEGKPSEEWLSRLEAVRELLTAGGRTLVQGALGWLWARSGQCVPIPGFKNEQQVAELVGAFEHGPLSAESMSEIDRLLQR